MMAPSTTPAFWRDDALPFIEARYVEDGRTVCYERHFHDTFSIGQITAGRSTYLNGRLRETVGEGAVVIMNPGDVHACNPVADERWAYRMLYVDRAWLAGLQHDLGFDANHDLRAFSTAVTNDAALFAAFAALSTLLADESVDTLRKETAAVAFFGEVQRRLDPAPCVPRQDDDKVREAAEFISDNRTRRITLEELCRATDLSASYLIRAFKRRYGLTPHAYLVNRRVEYGQVQLRRGRAIADVALDAGFADQAHFQRAFKRLLAATPRQYRA
ncbi:MAG TPA: AraC family transcriptional regulator [Tahibacter sp.]|nr:AraC family transcriptional regulator [Tahibacter sp.]